MTNPANAASGAHFPLHNAPRVWLLTSGDSPIGISLARQSLEHGDYVVAGVLTVELNRDGPRGEEFKAFLAEVTKKGWRERLRVVGLDAKYVANDLLNLKSLWNE